jgi:hypothetical protein
MKYSEWDRLWSEWVSEDMLSRFVTKSLNRNAHAHEDFTPILKPDFKGFTTNGTHTHRLYNKNKDLG